MMTNVIAEQKNKSINHVNKNSICENNIKTYLLFSVLAIVSFLNWYFRISDTRSLLVFGLIGILLIFLRADTIVFVFFIMFVRMGIFLSPANTFQIITNLITGYLFIKIIIVNLLRKQFNLKGMLIPSLTLITIYILISILWTDNKIIAIKDSAKIFIGYLYYLLILNEKKKINFFIVSLGLSFILIVFNLEYLVLILRSGKYLPSSNKAVVLNFWNNPNGSAVFYILVFPISLYKYFSKEKIKMKFLFIIMDLLSIYIIIYLFGRSVFLGIITAFLFSLFLKKHRKRFFLFFSFILISLMISLLLIVLFKNSTPYLFNKINFISSGRIRIYEIVINEIDTIPAFIFGKGQNSMDEAFIRNDVTPFVHNFILKYLAYFGIIGVILLFMNIRNIFKTLNNADTIFSKILLLSVIAYFMASLIDEVYEINFIGIYFYFLIAISEKNAKFLK